MISVESSGSYETTERFLQSMQRAELYRSLDSAAKQGVAALGAATTVETGVAATSWDYEIKITNKSCTIYWTNSDIENGFPVALMLQYGHATGTGGYVQGVDYINPAIRPTFDRIADQVWKAVTTA